MSVAKGTLTSLLKKNALLIKVFLTVLILWFIFRALQQKGIDQLFLAFESILDKNYAAVILGLVISLAVLNWYLESLKWHYMVSKFSKVPFIEAVKGTLAGLAFSLLFPNRSGEFGGRILFIPIKDRLKGIIGSFVVSWAQLLITIIMGGLAIIVLVGFKIEYDYKWHFITGSILLILVSILGYFKIYRLGYLRVRNKKFRRVLTTLKVLKRISNKSLYHLLRLSLVRYIVFSIQFGLLIYLFAKNFDIINTFIFIPVVFIINSAIPSFTLAELGIRELIGLELSNLFYHDDTAIVLATFMLWSINILIPSLVGSMIILTANLYKE